MASGPRPVVALNKPRVPVNLYLTQCKLCRRGIFSEQPHTWVAKPIGLSHTECAQREGLL